MTASFVLLLLAGGAYAPETVRAQTGAEIPVGTDRAEDERPVVGLVLSGGGARGFAHLGVLKVLHELRVPVDVIAATSMGAVVGGIFAAGLPYRELEALVLSEDWSRIFQDDPPRAQLPMRRKRLDRQQPLGLELGIGLDGVRFPPALVGGSKLTNALQAYTFRASGLSTFDELPIPFRAVAADVEDGSMVVLEKGSLGDAIRASMAVPGAFSPWTVDGRRLMDGGLVRNLPVDVAQSMGAEVMIVVDVSTPLDEAPEAESAIGIARRVSLLVMSSGTAEQIALIGDDDVYIQPSLTGIETTDFDRFRTAIAAGEAAAREVEADLRALAVSPEEFEAIELSRSRRLPPTGRMRPVEIVIDTTATRLAPGVVAAAMAVEPGDVVTPLELRADLSRVVGYGGFEGVDFRVVRISTGDRLELRPTDKRHGPTFLRPALSLTDQQRGTGAWSLRAYIDWTRLDARGTEAWGEVEVGTRHGIRLRANMPFDAGERVFLDVGASVGREEVSPEIDGLPVALDLTDREGFLGLGLRLGWFGDLVAGLGAARNTFEAPPDLVGTQDEIWNERSLNVRLDVDVLDRVAFPSSGARLQIDYARADTVAGGNVAFEQLRVEALGVHSVGRVTGTASVLTSSGLGSEVPFYRAVSIGGIERLTGLQRDAVQGGYAAVGRLDLSYRVGADADAPGGGLRLGISAEAGQAQATAAGWSWPPDDLRWGGSVWVGLETPLGPITMAFADVEGRKAGWVLQVGAPR